MTILNQKRITILLVVLLLGLIAFWFFSQRNIAPVVDPNENVGGEGHEGPIVEEPTEDPTENPKDPTEDPVGGEPSEDPNQGGQKDPEQPNQGTPEKPRQKGFGQAKPMDRLPKLTLEPRAFLWEGEEMRWKGASIPMLGPYCEKDFRFQIVDYKFDKNSGSTLTIEFGNTSGKSITVTEDNFFFYFETDTKAGSFIEGGTVTVAPGEVKTVVVRATHPQAQSFTMKIGTLSLSMPFNRDHKGALIKDATPYISTDNSHWNESRTTLVTSKEMDYAGNNSFKYQGLEVSLLQNDTLGKMKSPPSKDGRIAIVKVRLANTSDKEMTIGAISSYCYLSDKTWLKTEVDSSILDLLGEEGFPKKIPPGEIVEGYFPFVTHYDSLSTEIQVKSNLGDFVLYNIDTYNNYYSK